MSWSGTSIASTRNARRRRAWAWGPRLRTLRRRGHTPARRGHPSGCLRERQDGAARRATWALGGLSAPRRSRSIWPKTQKSRRSRRQREQALYVAPCDVDEAENGIRALQQAILRLQEARSMMSCERPGCTGEIDSGYCDVCGYPPALDGAPGQVSVPAEGTGGDIGGGVGGSCPRPECDGTIRGRLLRPVWLGRPGGPKGAGGRTRGARGARSGPVARHRRGTQRQHIADVAWDEHRPAPLHDVGRLWTVGRNNSLWWDPGESGGGPGRNAVGALPRPTVSPSRRPGGPGAQAVLRLLRESGRPQPRRRARPAQRGSVPMTASRTPSHRSCGPATSWPVSTWLPAVSPTEDSGGSIWPRTRTSPTAGSS